MRPYPPSKLSVLRAGPGSVRLTWVDDARYEDGFRVEKRRPSQGWREAKRLPENTEAVDIDGLTGGGRYDFRVFAYNDDACALNGHRWIFVAPVTDLSFNLSVESPDGEVWTHRGFLGLTASARSDTAAFACR